MESLASFSSSSPSLLPAGEYKVFLSFRGPDVRNTFADHLYNSLACSKIRTFRDEEELDKGEGIAPSLIRAISESKIYIPVITKQYASSKWCLQELAQMVECWKQEKGHLILPIFYFVDPRDVRHQQGPYQQAFEQHALKHSQQTVEEWKEALRLVGQMKGWHVTESKGQGAVVEEVISKVELHLRSMYTLVTGELVGIDIHVEEVMKLLNSGSSEGKVSIGIHGMGGIGKTTLSKAVYNKICAQFDRCCFLEDVRETLTKSDGAMCLQNKVISSILKKDDYQVKNISEGINMIKERVCKHKVLLVIDDIDENFEFNKILGKLGDFSIGTGFIFTTRNKWVLDFLPGCKLYEPGEMNDHYSFQLFSKHAFGMDQPPEDYVAITKDFVKVAAGLPLALEVIGSLVFHRERKFWEEKLRELRDIPSTKDKVQERLKVSYNELRDNEKQIFLDIACCFIGEDKEIPWYMWSGCNFYPEIGVNTLIQKSLIKLDGERNQFWMHDHVRDLGRAIVKEENVQNPYRRSRIWSNEDALNMLRNEEGNDQVEVLRINMDYGDSPFTNKMFKKLSGLRYLEMHGGELTGDFSEILPNITCLRLDGCKSLPSDLNMKKMTVLDLYGCSVKAEWRGWNGGILAAKKLKVLRVRHCYGLKKAPNFSLCGSLELLNVEGCFNMEGGLHIANLKNLKKLNLSRTKITELTGDIEKLEQLQEMNAKDSNLLQLPVGMERLSSLQILDLESDLEFSHNLYMMELPRLPTGLKKLSLSSLCRVPNLVELQDLEYLRFFKSRYPEIPADIWKLSKLKELALLHSPCHSLLQLVELETQMTTSSNCSTSPALPSSLTSLELYDCGPMERLPSLANLNNLTRIRLVSLGVQEISGLGELRGLKSMVISVASNLRNLDGLENLLLLTSLVVIRCGVLERLPSLANLIKLETLEVRTCPVLAEIIGLGDLKGSLSSLEIEDCPSLSAIVEGPNRPEVLQHLGSRICGRSSSDVLPHSLSKFGEESDDNGGCVTLSQVEEEDDGAKFVKRFPDISGLTNLKNLNIVRCKQFTEVAGFERLVSLEKLEMDLCTSITKLPDLSELNRNLKELNVRYCWSLIDATGIDRVDSLRKLVISVCNSIKVLPSLSGLKNLEELDLSGCGKLIEVKGIEGLESLKKLLMYRCSSLQELGDLSGLKNLREFDVRWCSQLIEVKGIEGLESLERLLMAFCGSLQVLGDLSGLKNLREFDVGWCSQLIEVKGIEGLESLERLLMAFCGSLQVLGDLSGLKNLREFDVSWCSQLIEVKGIEGLESLEKLLMYGCSSLQELGDLSGLKNLKEFDIRRCSKLREVKGLNKKSCRGVEEKLCCCSLVFLLLRILFKKKEEEAEH